MFAKLVCIESANRLPKEHLDALGRYARQVVLYDDIPKDDAEIQKRIGDADAVLVSYTSHITGGMLRAAPKLRYVGMCCSLYSPESANVDILSGNALGITTTGVRRYGDEGVPEYVVSELVRLLHGFYGPMWRTGPTELGGQRVGVAGLGDTGTLIARALRFFGAQVWYTARSPKAEKEAELGVAYLPLNALLQQVDILCCCVNRNTILLHRREFELFGNGKILVNTSIGPVFDEAPLRAWLARPGNFLLGDMPEAIDPTGALQKLPNVLSPMASSGMTEQARYRLGEKVLENIRNFLAAHPE